MSEPDDEPPSPARQPTDPALAAVLGECDHLRRLSDMIRPATGTAAEPVRGVPRPAGRPAAARLRDLRAVRARGSGGRRLRGNLARCVWIAEGRLQRSWEADCN